MSEKICCPNCAHINDACAKTCENCHADLVSGYQQTQEIKLLFDKQNQNF